MLLRGLCLLAYGGWMSRMGGLLIVVGLVVACSDSGAVTSSTSTVVSSSSSVAEFTTSTTLTPRSSMSAAAASYLDEALDAMRTYSINGASVDWELVEEVAFRAAAGAETPSQTYGAIRYALNQLNDDHSIFFTAAEAETFQHGEAVFVPPTVDTREGNLGYVSIGRYLGDVGDQADSYAADLAAELDGLSAGVCGWILDLQSNTGGNMWPMLAGLAPLLTQGEIGSFTYSDGRIEPWANTGTVALWDGIPMTTNSRPSTPDPPIPVAVLVGPLTGSSGEAVAVAFHGQDNTVFVGQDTAGLTTANEPVELSDGAIIFLTMSNFTDRNGLQYGQSIPVEPDLHTTTNQEAAVTAIQWLHSQPGCNP